MNVGFTYNVKKSAPSTDLAEQVDLEFDSIDVINGIVKALEDLGHKVIMIEADENAFLKLKELKDEIDIVFNIAEGLRGDARESQIPVYCEALGIAYTHSGPTTHAISLDKEFTKLLLKGAGTVKVPSSHVVVSRSHQKLDDLSFPVIVKPNKEGSSKGILDKNVVKDVKDLDQRIEEISEKFTKEVIVEEFIDGREFTVAVMGNTKRRVLPIIEQKFDFLPKNMNKIASFELKWLYEDSLKDLSDAYDCPAKLDKKTEDEIVKTSIEICDILDIRDCARIDYRLDSKGDLYFIEINSLPGINPDIKVISYFPLAARTAGISFKDMVGEILNLALERYDLI
ncbi:MAG: ATP-grasp domain-containing protein [Microgenomates group bacterium]